MELGVDFDWNDTNQWFRETISAEMADLVYEKVFTVNPGDTVLDLGASVGPFLATIMDRPGLKMYAVEPMSKYHSSILHNTKGLAKIIHGAISDLPELTVEWGGAETVKGIDLPALVKEYGIEKIDFLKTDCECGEYTIFKPENIEWLKANCKYCVGEWHLADEESKAKFRLVRDLIFPQFKRVEVFSVCGTNIAWDLYNEHFLEYYTEVIIHIEL